MSVALTTRVIIESVGDAATSLFLRGVPRDVIRLAKAEAARRGETLGAVVASALRSKLGDAAPSDELATDLAWFEAHRARLVRKHPGEFVAILDARVVDHDLDFDALAGRVFARHGVRSILMPHLTARPEVVRVRSPRRAAR